MNNSIQNKVASSSIITFDLEQYYPVEERITYDLKQNLFQELILKEKELRDFVKTHNWESYQDKYVNVTCSADAIVPTWAFLVIVSHLQPYAKKVIVGSKTELEKAIFDDIFRGINWEEYKDKKVVLKGCANVSIPNSVYAEATRILSPIVKLLMFGEACSSVPIYKKPKAQRNP